MKILFIKTYRQNFPEMFKRMAETSGNEVFLDKITKPGASLIELYEEQEAQEKLKSQKWDYIVIQERTIKALQKIADETILGY